MWGGGAALAAAALLQVAGPARAETPELEIAYQREFAYLQAERAALTERRAALDQQTARRVADAEAEIGALQGAPDRPAGASR